MHIINPMRNNRIGIRTFSQWLVTRHLMWRTDQYHDDVIKWKHFPHYWPFVHKGQWRGALMFSLIWAWINGWVNSREAGDLRRHRAHYDVIVMITRIKGDVMNDAFLHRLNMDSERMKWSIHELWLKLGFTITMTSWWARWRFNPSTSRLFTQPYDQAHIKEIIKAPRHWPLWGKFTGDSEFLAQRASNVESVCIWWRHHTKVVLQLSKKIAKLMMGKFLPNSIDDDYVIH